MSEIKLKPCPFCGGKAENEADKNSSFFPGRLFLRIRCSVCKVSTDFFTADVYTCAAEDAAEVWNRRVKDATN